jgi:hypothetical protein
VPEAQPYDSAVVVGEELVGVNGVVVFFVNDAAVFHLIDVGEVGTEKERLG